MQNINNRKKRLYKSKLDIFRGEIFKYIDEKTPFKIIQKSLNELSITRGSGRLHVSRSALHRFIVKNKKILETTCGGYTDE